ncbi:MAG: bifunctional aminodeoxychorismate synthase component I/aminotransferase, partial [Thiomonas sp. 13-64-67]
MSPTCHRGFPLYQQPVARWQAWQAEQVEGAFQQIEDALNAGRQVALLVHYEAAQALAGLPVHAPLATPLVEALAFDAATRMTAAQTQQWLQAQSASLDGGQPCGVAALQPGITQADYTAALARIAAHLRAG